MLTLGRTYALSVALFGAMSVLASGLGAQDTSSRRQWPKVERTAPSAPAALVPALDPLVARKGSELRDVVERYAADAAALGRRYSAEYSPERQRRIREFLEAWRGRLRTVDFDKLGQEGRVDYVLLDNELKYQLEVMRRSDKLFGEMASLVSFARPIIDLQDRRR